MTEQDTLKILRILQVSYPQFYKGMNKEKADAMLSLWSTMFAEDDAKSVAIAVKAFIAADEKGFPPVIGQIRAKLRLISKPEKMDAAEAWSLVSTAAENGYYGFREEYAKLPPLVQKVLGRAQTLKEYSMLSESVFNSVTQSNFIKAYNTLLEQETEIDSLPQSIKEYRLNQLQSTAPTCMQPTKNIAEIEAAFMAQNQE